MKIKILTMICLICISISAFAKKGAEIPVPVISATKAIALASEYFNSNKTQVIDGQFYKKNEYILISISYTDNFEDNKWAWKIIFIHPIQNDHSVTVKIVDEKNITLSEVTE